MRNWLHLYQVRHATGSKNAEWAYARAGADRPLLKSTSRPWVLEHAIYFASKHKLLLFVHQHDGQVVEHLNFGGTVVSVSADFKTHYNNTMTNKLAIELPNLKDSANVKEVVVRAVFKDKEEPEYLNVKVLMRAGNKIKFKVGRYGFPDATLLARLGLLV